MQLTYAKKKSTFFILMLFTLITIMLFALPVSSTGAKAAASDPFQETLPQVGMTVTAYTKNGTTTGTDKAGVTINGSGISQSINCTSYNWKDVKYFKISMTNLIAGIDDVVGNYEYSYEVTYFPAVVDGTTIHYDTAAIMTAPIYPIGTESNVALAQTKESIKSELYFFIDDNEAIYKDSVANKDIPMANANTIFSETDYATQGGWGVYIFTFNCMDKSTSGSCAYELLPTNLSDLKDKPLTVTAEKVSSSNSINNAYLFSVNEDYQYINRELITWKIKGNGSNGKKYVLVEADKTGDNEEPLYQEQAIKRTGPSFKLDTSIQGKWKAEAVIYDSMDSNKKVVARKESEEVSTIKPFSTQSIIWIVTGVTVVAVAIVATVIIVNIKKERTW